MKPEELRPRLAGLHAYPVTPFTEGHELNEQGLRGNIRFLLDLGITILNPLGSTGEFPNLSETGPWPSSGAWSRSYSTRPGAATSL